MAFTRTVLKNSLDSHQASPAYVLTFVRWSNRDTVNYNTPAEDTRRPLVVINDAVAIQVSDSKASVTGSCNITLKAGDINYSTAVAPGDFVFVNLLNNENDAVRVAQKALGAQAINRYEDGFKGLYKVQKVRRQLISDPGTGQKMYQFVINAFSFSEFNTIVYYNPTAAKAFKESRLLFLSNFADWWGNFATKKEGGISNLQKILIALTKALFGTGLTNKSRVFGKEATSNDQFTMPALVGRLMGNSGSKFYVSDVYHFIYGIWKNKQTNNSQNASADAESIAKGMNPSIKAIQNDSTFFEAGTTKLQGFRLLSAEDFNYKTIWSIIKAYMNPAINEAYTTNRVALNGSVYPTLIVRQKPFTSEHFTQPAQVQGKKGKKGPETPYTKFFELPRWRINPDLLYSMDLGKDEVGRINYVQLFGRSISILPGLNEALQARNIFFDRDDIKRHGLKPAIVTTNFDFVFDGKTDVATKAKAWSWLLFDMLNGLQNKESGTLVSYGIQEPIAVGDNLEFDGNVYHIESVSHTLQIQPNGTKAFRTSINVSHGVSLESNVQKPVYPQQEHTFTEFERQRDYNREQILPGLSDTQFLPYSEGKSRTLGELTATTEERQSEQATFTRPSKKETGPGRASTITNSFDAAPKNNNEHRPTINSKKKKDK